LNKIAFVYTGFASEKDANSLSLPSHPGEVERAYADSQAFCLWLYSVVPDIVTLNFTDFHHTSPTFS
jgi:hypothetical protein